MHTIDGDASVYHEVEGGVYCGPKHYSYLSSNLKSDSDNKLAKIYETEFDVRGLEDEPMTYFFNLDIGVDFATGAQLNVMIRRKDEYYDPSQSLVIDTCLLEKSCILGQ
jgi:hypothetical protein